MKATRGERGREGGGGNFEREGLKEEEKKKGRTDRWSTEEVGRMVSFLRIRRKSCCGRFFCTDLGRIFETDKGVEKDVRQKLFFSLLLQLQYVISRDFVEG